MKLGKSPIKRVPMIPLHIEDTLGHTHTLYTSHNTSINTSYNISGRD